MIQPTPRAVRMNSCLFFVAFAMKFAGCSKRMRRDGWIKARYESSVRMKPPHGGSGGVARGGGGGGLRLSGISVGGVGEFSGEEGSGRVKGLEKPATCVGRASGHDRVPPECAFLSPESGSRVQTLCQSRPIAACETTIRFPPSKKISPRPPCQRSETLVGRHLRRNPRCRLAASSRSFEKRSFSRREI